MHSYTIYFKERNGFDRFINKLYEKYKSLGKISGIIKLNNITKEEKEVLSRLFGEEYEIGSNICISVKKFINIMNNSKFIDFDINTLVKEYLNTDLISKKEEININKDEENMYYEKLCKDNMWFKDIINKKSKSYNIIHQRYLKNKKSLKKELTNIINLINNLPKEKVLLPIYASSITQNPHYLDIDNSHSVLFFSVLSDISNMNYPNTREEKIKLLEKHNIGIDNISNFAITYKLLSNKESINSFNEENEPLILNIQNIMNIEKFDTKKKRVFIFENPSILSEIINKNIDESVIIADGFPNTSVHLLIEKLIKTNNKLYYNGDFDPEGVLIASKLKEKYKDNIELFCYAKEDYECCTSKNIINASRMSKLNKVNDKELNEIKNILMDTKHSIYQENNKERLLEFINNIDS